MNFWFAIHIHISLSIVLPVRIFRETNVPCHSTKSANGQPIVLVSIHQTKQIYKKSVKDFWKANEPWKCIISNISYQRVCSRDPLNSFVYSIMCCIYINLFLLKKTSFIIYAISSSRKLFELPTQPKLIRNERW